MLENVGFSPSLSQVVPQKSGSGSDRQSKQIQLMKMRWKLRLAVQGWESITRCSLISWSQRWRLAPPPDRVMWLQPLCRLDSLRSRRYLISGLISAPPVLPLSVRLTETRAIRTALNANWWQWECEWGRGRGGGNKWLCLLDCAFKRWWMSPLFVCVITAVPRWLATEPC